jgi:uncharacterized membrane protein (DUF485 family)
MRIKNNLTLVILCWAVFLILCYVLFEQGIWRGHDWLVHFQRMISLNYELNGGQIPPLFDYWTPGQFGYSWQLFYPPLSSWLFLLTRIITFETANTLVQMKIVFLIIFIIAFMSAYYAAKRQHGSAAAGYLCAILFVTSGYFLTNIFVRFALGEILAMSFMPLFLRGCSSLLEDRKDIWLIPFTTLAIALSNIPSIVVMAIFFVLFFVMNAKTLTTKQNIKFFMFSLLVILTLSAFYWLPLLYHIRHSEIFATSGKLLNYNDLFKFSSGVAENIFSMSSRYGASNHGMYLSIGIIQLILLLAYLWRGESHQAKKILLVALLFIAISTHLFPWYLIPSHFPIIKLIQFPWRLLSCATAIVALYTAGMLAGIMQRKPALVTMLAVLCIAGMFLPMRTAITHRHLTLDPIAIWDDYLNNSSERPENFDHLKINDFAFFANKNALISNTVMVDGYPEMTIAAQGQQLVTLPFIMYSGYYVMVDDKKTSVSPLDNGLVGVLLADGEHKVRLAYNISIVMLPRLISMISLFILLIFIICRHRRLIRGFIVSQRFSQM